MKSEIRTERLVLRPRSVNDLEACIAMDRDPLVTKYVDGPWDDPEHHRSFILSNMVNSHPHPFGYWTITELGHSETFLGWVMIIPTGSSVRQAEIGWRLSRRCWGQGIATEAANEVVKLAHRHSRDLELFAAIHPDNSNSIKVALKIGMTFSHSDTRNGNRELFYTLQTANV